MTTGRINQVARPTRLHAHSGRKLAAHLWFAVPSLPSWQQVGHHRITESRHATSSSSATLEPPLCQAGFAEADCCILAVSRRSAAPTWQVVALRPATPSTTSPHESTRRQLCRHVLRKSNNRSLAPPPHLSVYRARASALGFHHARYHGRFRGSRVATVNCTTTAPPSWHARNIFVATTAANVFCNFRGAFSHTGAPRDALQHGTSWVLTCITPKRGHCSTPSAGAHRPGACTVLPSPEPPVTDLNTQPAHPPY